MGNEKRFLPFSRHQKFVRQTTGFIRILAPHLAS